MVEDASGPCLFLQRDPFGYEDSVNLYAGLGNDPINHRDPTGAASEVDGRQCEWIVLEAASDSSGYKTANCGSLYWSKGWGWIGAKAGAAWRATLGRSEKIQSAVDTTAAIATDVVETQEDRLGYAAIDKAREVRSPMEQYPASEQFIKEKSVEAVEKGVATAAASGLAWRSALGTVLDDVEAAAWRGKPLKHQAVSVRGIGTFTSENVEGFLSNNSRRISKKLAEKIKQQRLPFTIGREGYQNALGTVRSTLNEATHVARGWSARGQYHIVDIYSRVTGFTVRVREDGTFDTLIEGPTPHLKL